MAKLNKGSALKSVFSDMTYIVDKFLKAGGQGSVYQVSSGGNVYALKWYSKKDETLKRHFKSLIQRGAPKAQDGSGDKRFVWPQDLIVNENGFGYTMDLIDMPKYHTLHRMTHSLYIRQDDKIKMRVLCDICINIAEAFDNLHRDGYCYKDISPNNIIFNISNGEVLIFDIDNVVVNGVEGEIDGTPKFMAPEVILKKTKPNTATDRFSLAAYFFHLLVGHYPFEGKIRDDYVKNHGVMDEAGFKEVYGLNAVFCFNTSDKRNNLNSNDYQRVVERWNYTIPLKLKEKFAKTFVTGLPFAKRTERTTDREWVKLFKEFRDNIVTCCCKKDYFPGAVKCLKCNKPLTPLTVKVRVKEKGVPNEREITLKCNLTINGKLISKRLSNYKKFAEVIVNPTTGEVGLRNLSELDWHYKDFNDKNLKAVPNKKIVSLKKGRTIAFIRGEVQIVVL
jgi:serine/threonine protein kinase